MTQVTINYWAKGDRFYVNDENKNSIGWFTPSRYAYDRAKDDMALVSDWKLGGDEYSVLAVIRQIEARAIQDELEISGDGQPSYYCQNYKQVVFIEGKSNKARIAKFNRVFTI